MGLEAGGIAAELTLQQNCVNARLSYSYHSYRNVQDSEDTDAEFKGMLEACQEESKAQVWVSTVESILGKDFPVLASVKEFLLGDRNVMKHIPKYLATTMLANILFDEKVAQANKKTGIKQAIKYLKNTLHIDDPMVLVSKEMTERVRAVTEKEKEKEKVTQTQTNPKAPLFCARCLARLRGLGRVALCRFCTC